MLGSTGLQTQIAEVHCLLVCMFFCLRWSRAEHAAALSPATLASRRPREPRALVCNQRQESC